MRVSDYFAPQIALHFHSYLRLHFPTKLTLTDTQKAYIYIQWAQRVCRIYALFVYYVYSQLTASTTLGRHKIHAPRQ